MAYTPFTGKSGTTVITYNSVVIPGWRTWSITEKGKPLPEPLDLTKAEDAAYTFVDDPLGGKTSESAQVTIEGLLSQVDKVNNAGILQFASGASYTLVITTTTGGDEYTLTNAVLKSHVGEYAVNNLLPYTLTFTNSTSPGAWATNGA